MDDQRTLFLLRAAQQMLDQERWPQAIEYLRQVLGSDPDHAGAHSLLALALLQGKRLHAAETEARLGLIADSESTLSHLAMASVMLAQRKPREAIGHVEICLASDPIDVEAMMLRGQAHMFLDARDKARADFARAIELAPESPRPLATLAHLDLADDRIDDAEHRAREALLLEPEYHDALIVMGYVLLRRDQPEAAREHAIWALRQNPVDPDALRLLCAIKAKTSWWLGAWWRFQTFVGTGSNLRSAGILVGMYLVYRGVLIGLAGPEHESLRGVLSIAWLGFCVYSWVAPAQFVAMLKKELAGVQLKTEF